MHIITQSCVLFFWMHLLTFVKSQDCALKQFLDSPLYDSNFDTSDLEASYSGGRQVRISCNVGYSGFFKIICSEGKWLHRGSKCEPRSCGHPGDAQFADFHLDKGDDFVFGSEVVYTCQKGYQMVSRNNVRRCMAEGWDGVVPVCEALQCPVIHLPNNVQVTGDPEQANFGNVVRFSCKSSTEVLIGTSEIYCDENGEWSSPAPTCEAIKCFQPEIRNGEVLGDATEYKENDILNFRCDPNYKKPDGRLSMCIKQGKRADWIPTPTCTQITCKLPVLLEGNTYEPSSKDTFLPGESVTVTCGLRYWISQRKYTAVSTCQNTGKWNIEPLCKEITCAAYDPHVASWDWYSRDRYSRDWYYRNNQHHKVTLDDTLRYDCRTGYKKPNGIYRATCTRQGWSPNPLCEVKTCSREDVPNTDIVTENKAIYNYNEEVGYVCKGGYEGHFTLQCGENQWHGRRYCAEKRCTKLDITDAYITYNNRNTYSPGEQVQYRCLHDRTKLLTLTCRYGKWLGPQSCSDTAQCGSPSVPHGFAVGPYNENLYYYTCNNGYKLNTKGWWSEAKCEDGKWSEIEECIVNHHCGPLPVIPNGNMTTEQKSFSDRKRVQIICANGYQRSHSVTYLSCSRGKWHSNGVPLKMICTPVGEHCSPPPKVANAVVLTSYQKEYLSDSAVTYQCRSNFTIVGANTTTCIDGKWNVTDIQCAASSQEE